MPAQASGQGSGAVAASDGPRELTLFSEMTESQRRAALRDLDVRACRELWVHVLIAQWQTALEPVRKETPAEISAARGWFGSRDFAMACTLAGGDPQCVMDAFRARLREVEQKERQGEVLREAVNKRGMSREEIRAVCAERRRSVSAVLAKGPRPSTGTLARKFGVSHAVMLHDLREIQKGNF